MTVSDFFLGQGLQVHWYCNDNTLYGIKLSTAALFTIAVGCFLLALILRRYRYEQRGS